MDTQIHKGHRERMKKRFVEHGLDSFEDHSMLELLLFFSIPQHDVNQLAHRLINSFGSIAGVFEATYEDLIKIDGVGESTAVLLHLIPQVCRRYMISASNTEKILDSSEKAGVYIKPFFIGAREEVVYMLCLDSKRKLLACREVSRGIANAAEINVRKMVEAALTHNATNAIIAHNHISGIALPSYEDEVTTKKVRNALGIVGVRLLDHIVVAGDDFVSMADSGFFV